MNENRFQAIIDDVKKSLPRKAWSLAIKTRIRAANNKVAKPEPENVEIDDYTRAVADRICKNHFSSVNSRVLLSQFVRGKSQLRSVEVNVKTGAISKNLEKGALLGVLVAFKINGEVKIGWSFYNKNHEVLPFTRKNAIRVAVIRGLVDGIAYNQTTSKIQIPISVLDALPDFILRTAKYYSAAPVNVEMGDVLLH